MATFRCKRSGNTVSFTNPDDIKGLRAHEGYEEINHETHEKIEVQSPPEETRQVLIQVPKKRGRPRGK